MDDEEIITEPTAEHIAALRKWVGEDATDEELTAEIIAAGTVEKAAHNILSVRLAGLLTPGAVQFSVPGYSENNSALISYLRDQIASLDVVIGGGSSTVDTITLHRAGRCGR